MALPVIAVSNQSTVLTDSEVTAALPGLQRQISADFYGYWDIDATLSFLSRNLMLPDGWWQLVITDDPDMADALGYHELSARGTPLAKVFAKLDKESGNSWTVTTSHELLEMLVDPDINLAAIAPDGTIYSYEVADAVEADSLGYELFGTKVSDFVTPKWFQPSAEASRLDFLGHLKQPFQLAPGGYISKFDPSVGWTQVMNQIPGAAVAPIPVGSRRQRRTIKRESWRISKQ